MRHRCSARVLIACPHLSRFPLLCFQVIDSIDIYLDVLATYADSIVVMKVFAGFCRACKAFDHKYRKMATEYQAAGANVKFFEMDWMANRDLCKSLQVCTGCGFTTTVVMQARNSCFEPRCGSPVVGHGLHTCCFVNVLQAASTHLLPIT